MRSVSHELVHHHQNCDGKLDNIGPTHEGYAQSDTYLREMEEDAYRRGNLVFRDWENQKNIKEYKKMKVTKEELKNFVYEAMKEVLNEKVRKDSPARRKGGRSRARVKPLEEVKEGELQEMHPDQARALGGAKMATPEHQELLRHTIEDAKRTLGLHDAGKMRLPKHVVDALGALVAGAGEDSQPGLDLGKGRGHFEEAAKPDFLDVDKDGDKKESMKDAADSVDESAETDDWYASSEEKDWKKPEEDEEDKKKKDLDSFGSGMAGAQSGVNEEVEEAEEEAADEETLSEWKNSTLYKKLLKEYTKR